ncbi:hypothetical protein J4731_06425 [Providencia rettgeri]|nr:hypothetical protein [Providencia rettgeri]
MPQYLLGFFIDCINIFMSAIALPDHCCIIFSKPISSGLGCQFLFLGLVLVMPISLWLAGRLGNKNYCVIPCYFFYCSLAQWKQ